MFKNWTLMKIQRAVESRLQTNAKGFITFRGNDVEFYYQVLTLMRILT